MSDGRSRTLKGLGVLVVGLGRFGGGVGVTRWLAGEGAVVTVTDQATPESLEESLAAIAGLGVTLHLGGHDPRDLDATDLVVVNPAVDKARSDFFQAVARRGIPWTTEINLFCERCPAVVIGVTGSYGKSTTCAMLAAALRAACDTGVYLGGNIGRSLLPDLPEMRGSDIVILEMSNAQLEDLPRIRWAPPIAVVTNLFPHHLDRYPAFSAYARAKLNIVCDSRGESKVILGDLHPEAEAMLNELLPDRAKRVTRVEQPEPPIALRVPGEHNRANAARALTVCRCLNLDEAVVREALGSFEGLPHRLQHVRTIDGVDYFNDSKATSPDATMVALGAFDRPIVAIVGGREKDVALTECAEALGQACRAVICTGESGPKFAKAVRRVGTAHQRSKSSVIVHETGSLEEGVRIARVNARAGEVVLFSPGAPSFDAYANFTARGRHFTDLVNAL
jgi:UDP-N-acetylmuramoylalanine--D-glutamate ligase